MPSQITDRTITVPVRLDDNIEFYVEAVHLGGPEKTGLFDRKAFGEITRAVAAIGADVIRGVAAIKPQKASIELGIEIGVEAGKLVALLVQGEGKANLKITLEWTAPGATTP